MGKTPHKRALLIAGPTASGKSALALDVARKLNGIIINADALQVYRELRILTARPLDEEMAQAPHRLYGHVPGTESYTVARWLQDVAQAIEDSWREGRLPIITGGTGLYFRALEKGLSSIPPVSQEIRDHWRSYDGDLHGELAARDPDMARRLRPQDRQRIVRALEVVETTGRSLLDWQQDVQAPPPLADVEVERVFMEVPRDELYARAERRFDQMIRAGALGEVETVITYDPALPMMKAIGTPELAAHVRGETTLEDAVTLAKTATRQYIKRQLTWWRGQMGHWRDEH
jgi:tRNA dimethylallyltransferase